MNSDERVALFVFGFAVLVLSVSTVVGLTIAIFKSVKYLFECKHRFALQDMRRTSDDPDSPERITWACYVCGREFKANCGLDIYKHGTADNSRGQS